MGCKLSSRPRSAFLGVRVIHINGYVEEYPGPVTVGDVTGKPPKLACFSPAQLLSFAPRPIAPGDALEPGRLYFLLPHTVFRSDTSPADLATLVTRLTALAGNGRGAPPTVVVPEPKLAGGRVTGSPADRHIGDTALAPGESQLGGRRAGYTGGDGVGRKMPPRSRSWRPMLDVIEEGSIGRSTRSLSSRGGRC